MMDRNWMYRGLSDEYLKGVKHFNEVAKKDQVENGRSFIYCPCKDCKNEKKFSLSEMVESHLIMRGFKEKYGCWNKHGEEGLNEGEVGEDNLEREIPTDHLDHDPDVDADILGLNEDDVVDHMKNIDEMVCNAERHANVVYNRGELAKHRKMIEDSKKPFYPGCDAR